MEATTINRAEHQEFVRRMDEANHRQSKRLETLEIEMRELRDLTTSVEKLAMALENMVREQERQGARLAALEDRDGEMWRKVTGYLITAVVGIVIGFIFKQIGM